ncbi:MAG: MotA/TolQ/ExbB proton channel family protein [Tannerella sp.]|jgi:biopolymer transport protein ExbB|nr:MotA/TolQ/ExbB proton channel family protein [Tannerella sp.]
MNLLNVLLHTTTLLQEDTPLDLSGEVIPTETQMNILELATKGGWIMIVLLVLSFIALYVFIQRWMVISRAAKIDDSFMSRIKDYIHDGKIDSALKLCETVKSPMGRMIGKGISRLGRPVNDILASIENAGNIEVAKLEKGFPLIATTAAGAPMIGFLGTVTGMVRAFFDMANAGANVDITLLSGGIYEALVTTVGGLVVGIVALFAYNFLVAKVDSVVNKMETTTMDFMDLLNEPAN